LNLVEPFLDAHEGHCNTALPRESDNRQIGGLLKELLKEKTNREETKVARIGIERDKIR
jgi:hypothetical protein